MKFAPTEKVRQRERDIKKVSEIAKKKRWMPIKGLFKNLLIVILCKNFVQYVQCTLYQFVGEWKRKRGK